MSSNGNDRQESDVNTTLIYSKALSSNDLDEHWLINVHTPNDRKREQNYENDPVQSVIHDIRGHEDETHIDVTGFQTIYSPSKVDGNLILNGTEEQVKELYYAEVEELLKRVTGADNT